MRVKRTLPKTREGRRTAVRLRDQIRINRRELSAALESLPLETERAHELVNVLTRDLQELNALDSLTQAAQGLIASCGGEFATRKLIANLSVDNFARRTQDRVLVRADEILNPRTATPLLTRADHVLAQARREGAQHAALTHEVVAAVEKSKRQVSEGYANHREPAPRAEGGVPNSMALPTVGQCQEHLLRKRNSPGSNAKTQRVAGSQRKAAETARSKKKGNAGWSIKQGGRDESPKATFGDSQPGIVCRMDRYRPWFRCRNRAHRGQRAGI